MFYKRILLFLIALSFTFSLSPSARADEAESGRSLAGVVDDIISRLPSEFTDGVDLGGMSTERRVEWLMTAAEDKIQEKIAEKVQDAIKEKLWNYAEEGIRAQAFLEIGVPKIRHAYAMGEEFDWTSIDAEIASRTDTNLRALSGAIQVAQIGWNTIQSYQQGDFRSAAETLGGEISQLLLQAYIPGFGTFMLGAQATIFLGNYVLDYATDTAIEGMLNNLYGMNSDPGAFAEWLIDQSPSDLRRDIDDKFADGMGFGYLYRYQGTDASEEKMKRRLLDELVEIRGRLARQQREQIRREREFQREVERYLQDYRRAEAELKEEAASVRQEVESLLQPVAEFKKQLLSLRQQAAAQRKQEVQEEVKEVEASIAEVQRESRSIERSEYERYYVPLPVDSLVAEYETLLSEVTSTPSGYNLEAMARMYEVYSRKREEAYERSSESTSSSLYRNYGDVRKSERQFGHEVRLLRERENIARLEARQRAYRLAESISEGLREINQELEQVREERDAALQAWRQKAERELNFSDWFFNQPRCIDTASRRGLHKKGYSAFNMLRRDGRLSPGTPGELHSGRNNLEENLEKIENDIRLINRLSSEKTSIMESYRNQVLNLRNIFKSLVPNGLIDLSPLSGQQYSGTWRERYETWEINYRSDKWLQSYTRDLGSRSDSTGISLLGEINPSFPRIESQDYLNARLSELQERAKLRGDTFRAVREGMEKNLQYIRPYADRDRALASMDRIDKNIRPILLRFLNRDRSIPHPTLTGYSTIIGYKNPDRYFSHKDGERCEVYVSAFESDGARFVEEMKEAWEAAKPYVERMGDLAEFYGDVKMSYTGTGSRRSPFDSLLASRTEEYLEIPERIAGYEKAIEEIETERLARLNAIEEEYEKMSADVMAINDPGTAMTYYEDYQNLSLVLSSALYVAEMGIDPFRRAYREKYEELHQKMEEYAELAREREMQAAQAREEERQRRAEAAERRRQEQLQQQVEDFYGQFAGSYSRRDLNAVLGMLDSNWNAEDGSNIMDLEETLSNSFRVFDEVECRISDLRINSSQGNIVWVEYRIDITGHIYRNRIRHEENSRVVEELRIADEGTVIVRTLGGQYW